MDDEYQFLRVFVHSEHKKCANHMSNMQQITLFSYLQYVSNFMYIIMSAQ